MQKTVYYCDQCKKIIGEKKHISLNVNPNYSGISIPPQKPAQSSWRVKKLSCSGFIHFCKGECIAKYFDKLIAEK